MSTGSHRGVQDLASELARARVHSGERYRHYKTGTIYTVRELAFLEASDELAVIYYDATHPKLVWVRTYSDFTSEVATAGASVPRFALQA